MPKEPGVYWFKGKKGELLYIGKAKNLKNRLTSYRAKHNLIGPSAQAGKTKLLTRQVRHLQYAILASELQALILEAELIRTYQPKYNIRLKDDRSPLYVLITDEPMPRVLTARKTSLSHASFPIRHTFGPYPSGYKTRQLLRVVRRIFPYCNATPKQKSLHQACFYSHIGLCSGICSGQSSRRSYTFLIKHLAQFLSGQESKVVASLTRSMKSAARQKDYEVAASARDQLNLITATQSARLGRKDSDELESLFTTRSQLKNLATLLGSREPLRRIECYDISNIQGTHSTGSMAVFINANPKTSEYRHFRIRSLKTPNDTGMIAEVVSRRATHPEWGVPNLIVIDGGKGQVNAATKALGATRWPHLPVIGIAKRNELLIIDGNPVKLPPRAPALRLVQHLRDEAHRFARNYYLKLHQKHLLAQGKN